MSGEWAKELFGPTLWVKASADAPPTATRTEEALAGKKFVGVYFSAHVSEAKADRSRTACGAPILPAGAALASFVSCWLCALMSLLMCAVVW
jgi:hypothetical protein